MIDDWKKEPTIANHWNTDVNYVCFIDENGDSSMDQANKYLKGEKNIDKSYLFLNLVGVMISKDDYITIRESFDKLKNKYWKNGTYLYKDKELNVLFHSREIRKKLAHSVKILLTLILF